MIEFKNTGQAKTNGEELLSQATYYNELVGELEAVTSQISINWLGDSTDINDIIVKIGEVAKAFNSRIIPSMRMLGNGVTAFATNVEHVASSKGEDSYWQQRADDFKEDWDYSNCDGIVDTAAHTVSNVIRTEGDVVETGLDGFGVVGEVAGDIYSGAHDVVAGAIDWIFGA